MTTSPSVQPPPELLACPSDLACPVRGRDSPAGLAFGLVEHQHVGRGGEGLLAHLNSPEAHYSWHSRRALGALRVNTTQRHHQHCPANKGRVCRVNNSIPYYLVVRKAQACRRILGSPVEQEVQVREEILWYSSNSAHLEPGRSQMAHDSRWTSQPLCQHTRERDDACLYNCSVATNLLSSQPNRATTSPHTLGSLREREAQPSRVEPHTSRGRPR